MSAFSVRGYPDLDQGSSLDTSTASSRVRDRRRADSPRIHCSDRGAEQPASKYSSGHPQPACPPDNRRLPKEGSLGEPPCRGGPKVRRDSAAIILAREIRR